MNRLVGTALLLFLALPSTSRAFDQGLRVFQSFPQLVAPDSDGNLFDFADHRDKVIALHLCASWCAPCETWAGGAAQLQADVDAAIGPGNFLQVDLLVQGPTVQPSTQADAVLWKSGSALPGVVLHAEGTAGSALSNFFQEIFDFYGEAGQNLALPKYFLLAPSCGGQTLLRGHPQGGSTLADDTQLTQSSLANHVIRAWNESTCIRKVLVDQVDRCGGIASPSAQFPDDPELARSTAEDFEVPAGQSWRIETVRVAGNEGQEFAHLAIYADDNGVPGTEVCRREVTDSWPFAVRLGAFVLDPPCEVPAGKHWLEIQDVESPSWGWRGGLASPAGEFAFRDPSNILGTGCTDWGPSSTCWNTTEELCFRLEGAFFHDGFESGDTGAW
jgi:hypothetical protein